LQRLATTPVYGVSQTLNPSEEDDDSSENDGGVDTDDPPRRDGLGRTTIGFEFEFLLAVSRIKNDCPDPHPDDNRWLSDHLIDVADITPAYKYTACNRVIDELRKNNVPARKMNNYCKSLPVAVHPFKSSVTDCAIARLFQGFGVLAPRANY
jgi:hypothetical protein